MMENKLLICIFLLLLAAAFLTGCGGDEEEITTAAVTTEAETTMEVTTAAEVETETIDNTREATESEKKAIEEAIPYIVDQKVMQYSSRMNMTKHLTDNDTLIKGVEVMETEMETKNVGSYDITYKVTVYKDGLDGDKQTAGSERETEAVLVKETVKVVTEAEANRLVKDGEPVIYSLGRVHFPKKPADDKVETKTETETKDATGKVETTQAQPIGITKHETKPEVATKPETRPTETTPSHTHDWKPVTEVVHHDAVYTTKWVVDKEAWDEQVVVKEAWDEEVTEYTEVEHSICGNCGTYMDDWSNDKISDHMVDHMIAGENEGWFTRWEDVEKTTVIHHDAEYKTVHHEATGHNEDVLEKAAYDETVTTGYKCSCGATK